MTQDSKFEPLCSEAEFFLHINEQTIFFAHSIEQTIFLPKFHENRLRLDNPPPLDNLLNSISWGAENIGLHIELTKFHYRLYNVDGEGIRLIKDRILHGRTLSIPTLTLIGIVNVD